MDQNELERLVRTSLDNFYARRIAKLSGLKLTDTLKKKNPYLFRAVGVQNASEIVERLLSDYMSSSDEGIFGDAFFEPIVKACSGGVVAPSEGVDVAVETDTVYKAIAVKSGPNIFNASQAKRMNTEFMSLRSRLQKLQKQFDALLGHGYGKKFSEPQGDRIYRIRSGQALWLELTGDPDFYLKLITLMRDYPVEHRLQFQIEWDKALNRFLKEFLEQFSDGDGSINWEKLVRFNSGMKRSREAIIEEQNEIIYQVLVEAEEALTKAQIIERTQLTNSAVSRALKRDSALIETGRVVKIRQTWKAT